MRYIIVLLLVANLPAPLRADGENPRSIQRSTHRADERSSQLSSERFTVTAPGEEVTTSSGRKMKIWSTSGPVPVAPAPAAPQPFDSPQDLSGTQIIVDERKYDTK